MDRAVEDQLRAMLRETWANLDAPSVVLPVTPAPRTEHTPVLPERYTDAGLLGAGGMGEVRRVYDQVLDRHVAMKLIRREMSFDTTACTRFVTEARATARLSHPAIVPVFDHGVTPEGRLYFTMAEIRGETLSAVIARAHADPGSLPTRLHRLVDLCARAVEGLAYAHGLGVVHRDVKPANMVVGEHGDLTLVDWGLVQSAGRGAPGVQGVPGPGQSGPSAVAGTPAYMAPEQARGEVDLIDARTDVYALGCVLYEILCGRPPFAGRGASEVVRGLARGDTPPAPTAAHPLPEELVDLVVASTRASPGDRPPDAHAFGASLRAWLDGESRRDRARVALADARRRKADIAPLAAAALARRLEAQALLQAIPSWESDEARAPAWAAEEAAAALEAEAARARREVDDRLAEALVHDAGFADAHAEIARDLRARQAEAEAQGRDALAADLEASQRRHLGHLPSDHAERRRAEAWLQGDGALTLHTDPPGAVAELYRYEVQRRRLVPVHVRTLGTTPLDAVPLPRGRWLVELRAGDRPPVRYPVAIGREEHWTGVPPGESSPLPIRLPRAEELGADDCYVPAGWARFGGDPEAPSGLPARRLWVDGFAIRRFPVTGREWIAFLDDHVAQGRRDLADRYAPRDRGRTSSGWGSILYGTTAEGRYCLVTDSDGDTWQADWPIIMVDHVAAWAMARWEAARTGQPWRLPGELEWEKAARGVDGRIWPWGDHVDPTWCANRLAFPGAPGVESVHTRPLDVSCYGVRGMAGGVLDWTADRMRTDGPATVNGRVLVPDGSEETEEAWEGRTATWRIVGRGGSRLHDLKATRTAFRLAMDPWSRSSNVSVRLARPL